MLKLVSQFGNLYVDNIYIYIYIYIYWYLTVTLITCLRQFNTIIYLKNFVLEHHIEFLEFCTWSLPSTLSRKHSVSDTKFIINLIGDRSTKNRQKSECNFSLALEKKLACISSWFLFEIYISSFFKTQTHTFCIFTLQSCLGIHASFKIFVSYQWLVYNNYWIHLIKIKSFLRFLKLNIW